MRAGRRVSNIFCEHIWREQIDIDRYIVIVGQNRHRKYNTHHVPPQIILLLILEPPQILQHTRTRICDVLCDSHLPLLEVPNSLARLPNIIAPRLLRVHIREPMYSMADTSKDLISDEVSTAALLVRQGVAVFWYALLCAGRSAVMGRWEVGVDAFCFF